MRFETLYKTDVPQQLSRAEFYQPQLAPETVNGKTLYFVREKHGWWDDASKKLVLHTTTLDPEEGFATLEDAEARYEQQLHHRASEGFMHSFFVDPANNLPVNYRRISPR